MSSACTLLCPSKDYAAALDAVETHLKAAHLDGSRSHWASACLEFPSSTLTFNTLVRLEPGDEFSKLVFSLNNFFEKIATSANANKQVVLHRISKVGMFIGIVGEPQFAEDEGHFDSIWSAAEKLDALVFTGEAILNAKGEKLLDQSGAFDVECSTRRHRE